MEQQQSPKSARFRPKYSSRTNTKDRLDPAARPQERTLKIEFEIAERFAPALSSAVEEEKNEIGGRLEGSFSFATEQALTDGAVAVGILYAAVKRAIQEHNAAAPQHRRVPESNPDWRTR